MSKHTHTELLEALKKFANMDTVDQGNQNLNGVRDRFLKFCPEYIAYCKAARAAISKATGNV